MAKAAPWNFQGHGQFLTSSVTFGTKYPTMRLPMFLSAVFASLVCVAQTFDRTHVVEVDSVTSAEALRGAAHKWFVDTFKDASKVIQMNDPATNTIVGKGYSSIGGNDDLHYTIEVQCKTGRARIRIYDITHVGHGKVGLSEYAAPSYGPVYDQVKCHAPGGGAIMEKRMEKRCVELRPRIRRQLESLESSIETALQNPVQKTSSDW